MQVIRRVTIDDPTTFTKQWTLEYPFRHQGPDLRIACHEGNHSLTDIMGGARKADAEVAR
jgi:hypothetical protein